MGNILKDQGKITEALEAFKKRSLSNLIMLRPTITWEHSTKDAR